MRRTKLNVVPPVSNQVMSLSERKTALAAKVETYAPDDYVASPANESRTQRVRRLQDEARALAREQISEFELLLDATARMAEEIANGGDVYAVGARELCRRLAEELPNTLQTLKLVSRKH
jgi:ABC-type phosphate transport system auxiliary subunit